MTSTTLNVGIGTTNPITQLQVNATSGDAIITTSTPGANNAYIRYVRTGSNGWAAGRDNNGAAYRISYAATDTPDFSTAANNYFNILNTGNVGIGITTPSVKLSNT